MCPPSAKCGCHTRLPQSVPGQDRLQQPPGVSGCGAEPRAELGSCCSELLGSKRRGICCWDSTAPLSEPASLSADGGCEVCCSMCQGCLSASNTSRENLRSPRKARGQGDPSLGEFAHKVPQLQSKEVQGWIPAGNSARRGTEPSLPADCWVNEHGSHTLISGPQLSSSTQRPA